LISQEVELAALDVGFDFDGVVKPQNENGPLSTQLLFLGRAID
jgi:hypothetical protein